MSDILALLVGAALVNNAVLGAMLGLDRVRSDDINDAFVFGTLCALATTLVAALHWPLARVLPFGELHALQSVALVLVVAAVTALVAFAVARAFAPLAHVMRGRWLAVAGNAAVIGGALIALRPDRSYAQTVLVASRQRRRATCSCSRCSRRCAAGSRPATCRTRFAACRSIS